MQVTLIDDIHQFDLLKTNWETVYADDPHAHIFVSWMWLKGWFEMTPFAWFVLAIRPDKASPYVAFFPVNIRILQTCGLDLIRELRMGSKPLGGYTGFVCLPEYETEAITSFATYLQHELSWDSFQMEHVLDPRLELFLESFPRKRFDVQHVNRLTTTCLTLPDSWEQYLQSCLGSKARRNLRSRIRKIEGSQDLRMVHVQQDNLERQVETAQMLSQRRWATKPERIQHWTRNALYHCFERGYLWLGVLWDRQTPVSAQAVLTDHVKGTAYSFFTGYDRNYARLAPGTFAVVSGIRDAIDNGFRRYDFLMGADDYKLALGAKQRGDAVTVMIRRKRLRSAIANAYLNLARQARDLWRKRHSSQ